MQRRVWAMALRAGQAVLAVGLLALLWRVAGGAEAARSLAAADMVWLAAALGALSVQTVLSALRWKLTAAHLGIHLSAAEAVREYYLSQVVNQSLPGGVIGDAGRAIRARGQAGLLASGQAVVFERLAGQMGLFVVTALAFGLTLAVPGGVVWPGWLIGPVVLFLACGMVLPVGVAVAARSVGRVGRLVAPVWRAMRRCLFAPGVIGPQIGLSLATTLCNLAAFGFCAQAVGHPLTVAAVAAFVPLILLTMLVPLTIGGWGLREGAAVVLFPVAGVSAGGGLAASVAFGLMLLVSVLPGVAILLVRRRAPVMPG